MRTDFVEPLPPAKGNLTQLLPITDTRDPLQSIPEKKTISAVTLIKITCLTGGLRCLWCVPVEISTDQGAAFMSVTFQDFVFKYLKELFSLLLPTIHDQMAWLRVFNVD